MHRVDFTTDKYEKGENLAILDWTNVSVAMLFLVPILSLKNAICLSDPVYSV